MPNEIVFDADDQLAWQLFVTAASHPQLSAKIPAHALSHQAYEAVAAFKEEMTRRQSARRAAAARVNN
jgi:hypothetical protein